MSPRVDKGMRFAFGASLCTSALVDILADRELLPVYPHLIPDFQFTPFLVSDLVRLAAGCALLIHQSLGIGIFYAAVIPCLVSGAAFVPFPIPSLFGWWLGALLFILAVIVYDIKRPERGGFTIKAAFRSRLAVLAVALPLLILIGLPWLFIYHCTFPRKAMIRLRA